MKYQLKKKIRIICDRLNTRNYINSHIIKEISSILNQVCNKNVNHFSVSKIKTTYFCKY